MQRTRKKYKQRIINTNAKQQQHAAKGHNSNTHQTQIQTDPTAQQIKSSATAKQTHNRTSTAQQ